MRHSYRTTLGAVVLAAAVGAGAGVALAQIPSPAAAPQAGPPAPPATRQAMRDRTLSRADFVDARIARLTALDADRDGMVSRQEREAARQARRTERADARFAKLDADGDGAITRAELGAAARPAGPGAHGPRHRGGRRPDGAEARRSAEPVVIADAAARLGERFDKMDADRDGLLTADERRAAAGAHRAERRAERGQRRAARQAASPAPASE